jgi:methylphosphotriester-DNA--protein-cysteine methyltransferase
VAFNAVLGHVLIASWRAYCQGTSVPDSVELHPAVERAVALIDHRPQVESLDTVADHAGLSPARLSRLFAQQVGVSLITFRNSTRVRRFLELYGQGRRRTMLQAALDAGFGSYPQFHRVFRQTMGISPAQYRRTGGAPPAPEILI